MFKLFRRKLLVYVNTPQEKAAGWLVAKILWAQGKWSLYMERRVNRLPIRSKKFGLMVFVGLSVLICVSIVIETFTKPYSPGSLKAGNIRNGKYIISTGDPPATIPKKQYKRVVAFRLYMDSLSGSVPGRKVFDSINKCRPGLLDSAIALEQLYHHQNK